LARRLFGAIAGPLTAFESGMSVCREPRDTSQKMPNDGPLPNGMPPA